MSAEDGDTQNLQTHNHKPVGFLHAVEFRMDATAPRKWLGILTQRRVLYFGVFTEDPGRLFFFNSANCIYWIVAGGDAPRTQVDSLPLWIAAGLPAHPENHSSLDHITWGESGRCFVGLGLQW